MSTQILYNGINPFSGICGTPLVQINDQFIKYDEQWGVKNTITLSSTITGGCDYFNQLISGQNSIIGTFGKDYQSLQIIESGQTIFNKPYCIIRGINFSDSQYLKLLPFNIEIDCYESGFFSGVYGILEPKNEFSFVQEKDQSIQIEHTMSCRGFNTSSTNSNALQNAKNYINSISGFNNQITPYFIQICSGIVPSLIEVHENIDRVVGTYSITETYIADKECPSGILRFISDYSSGINDGFSIIKINGNLKTAKNYPISLLRQRYSGFNPFISAVECYSGATNGLLSVNPYYLQSGITEKPFERNLDFNIIFDDSQIPNPYLDYSIEFNQDFFTSITTAKFNGTIKGRGELSQRWQIVQNYATGIDPFAITFNEYIQDGFSYFLNSGAISQSITKNPFIGEINLTVTYNDKILPPQGLVALDYNFSTTPSIEKIVAIPILNDTGNFYISDLGYSNRAILKVNGTATVDPAYSLQSGIQILTAYINSLGQMYATGSRCFLEEQQIDQGNRGVGLDINFSSTWSYEDILFNP